MLLSIFPHSLWCKAARYSMVVIFYILFSSTACSQSFQQTLSLDKRDYIVQCENDHFPAKFLNNTPESVLICNAEYISIEEFSTELNIMTGTKSPAAKYRLRRDYFLLGSFLSFLAAGGCRLNANQWYQAYQRAITVEEANSWHKKVRTYDIAAMTLTGIGFACIVPVFIYHKKMKIELNAGVTSDFDGGKVAMRLTF